MIHKLGIKENVDYYTLTNVNRTYNAKGNRRNFDTYRYVNVFLHPDVPEQKCNTTFKSSTSKKSYPCPEGDSKPLDVPPPLKKGHKNYNPKTLNKYFEIIKNEHKHLNWDFNKGIYVYPTKPLRQSEILTMKSTKHTYNGNCSEVKNINQLIDKVTNETQIIGLLGHGMYFAGLGPIGRVVIGQDQILDDSWPKKKKSYKSNKLLSKQKDKLKKLSNKISPLAVIILYHCNNGRKDDFIQKLSDYIDRSIFAYTGFLAWDYEWMNKHFTINQIKNKWNMIARHRLMKCEFGYQPERGSDPISPTQGEWVVATPSRYDGNIK